MKVVIINSRCGSGSTGKICVGIGKMLSQYGHKVVVAYGLGSASFQNSKKIGFSLEVFVHKVLSRLFDCEGLGSIFSTLKFVHFLKSFKPDVVNIHTIHGSYLNYPILFNYLYKHPVKVVWTLHDCWSFTGHCAHFYECEKWKVFCHECPYKNDYPQSLFLDHSKSNYLRKKRLYTQLGDRLTIVPVSNWLKGLVKESFFKNNRIEVIHNGIDTDLFKIINQPKFKTKYSIEDKTMLLGVALPWSKYKGFSDFFEIRKKLSDEYVIVLVGLDESQMKQLLPGMIGLSRTDSVAELMDIYNSADIFVNPTYQDTFPTVNLEAMACGTPVVTYKTGGSPESVKKETGCVVPQGDIDSMCDTIVSLSKSKSSIIGYSCRQNVVTNYNQETQFYKYVDLINSI